jgi:hypothetical protein
MGRRIRITAEPQAVLPVRMVGERHRHEHVHAAQQTPGFRGAVKMT